MFRTDGAGTSAVEKGPVNIGLAMLEGMGSGEGVRVELIGLECLCRISMSFSLLLDTEPKRSRHAVVSCVGANAGSDELSVDNDPDKPPSRVAKVVGGGRDGTSSERLVATASRTGETGAASLVLLVTDPNKSTPPVARDGTTGAAPALPERLDPNKSPSTEAVAEAAALVGRPSAGAAAAACRGGTVAAAAAAVSDVKAPKISLLPLPTPPLPSAGETTENAANVSPSTAVCSVASLPPALPERLDPNKSPSTEAVAEAAALVGRPSAGAAAAACRGGTVAAAAAAVSDVKAPKISLLPLPTPPLPSAGETTENAANVSPSTAVCSVASLPPAPRSLLAEELANSSVIAPASGAAAKAPNTSTSPPPVGGGAAAKLPNPASSAISATSTLWIYKEGQGNSAT